MRTKTTSKQNQKKSTLGVTTSYDLAFQEQL